MPDQMLKVTEWINDFQLVWAQVQLNLFRNNQESYLTSCEKNLKFNKFWIDMELLTLLSILISEMTIVWYINFLSIPNVYKSWIRSSINDVSYISFTHTEVDIYGMNGQLTYDVINVYY